jgi:hypothetical protein
VVVMVVMMTEVMMVVMIHSHADATVMMVGLLLWLIGIPLPIILLVWLLGGLHG